MTIRNREADSDDKEGPGKGGEYINKFQSKVHDFGTKDE